MDPRFATTQWTLVWEAAREDSQHGRPALGEVVRRYWQPLYSFARQSGLTSQDAEDATQEFLSAVLDGKLLENADPAKGKFRSFLLTAWKRFLVDQYRKSNAQKRGGGARHVSLDVSSGEQNWLALESREPDPERVFVRSWANSLLEEAKQRLRQEYYSKNKSAILESLMPLLTQNLTAQDYADLGKRLELTPGAVKVSLHRLRQKFGAVLRGVVAETVEGSDVDTELGEILEVLKVSNSTG